MANAPLAPPRSVPGASCVPARLEEAADGYLLKQFVRHSDEAAFAVLVRRHGSMVLGVCRRVLRNQQDAEDAFQATFLVLVRKAGSLGKPELLANWLYGVAFRTAQQARVKAARRSHHEREAATMSGATSVLDTNQSELRELIDKELFRLPDKYRAPLVLCYLEGKTNEEAAQLLGWPLGSMSARLARGRELLRERLSGKKKEGSAALAAFGPMLLAASVEAPAVSPGLEGATVQAAIGLLGTKTALAGALSPAVRELMDGTLFTLASGRRWFLGGLLAALAAALAGATAYAVTDGFGSGSQQNTGGSCH